MDKNRTLEELHRWALQLSPTETPADDLASGYERARSVLVTKLSLQSLGTALRLLTWIGHLERGIRNGIVVAPADALAGRLAFWADVRTFLARHP